jgi:hypothetical protein
MAYARAFTGANLSADPIRCNDAFNQNLDRPSRRLAAV